MSTARKGKIARCPAHIREEVCRRLLDGEPAGKILPWLNSQAEVLKMLDEHFGEEPVTPQNLSEWRQGGYQDWLGRRERIQNLGELSKYAAQLGAAAGGSVSDGAAAILGGKILEAIEAGVGLGETPEDGEPAGFDVEGFTKAIVALRSSDLEARKATQRDRLLDQRERTVALAERAFQVKTCEAFLAWFKDQRAREIAESTREPQLKITQLRELMFGSEDTGDAGATS